MPAPLTTDVDKRLLRTTKFPPEFNTKVDMTKINVPLIKKWVSDEVERILGNDDDVVTDTIFNLVEGPRYPDIKALQITLNGFLDKDAPKFCHDLWKLCLSAQENPQGIPKELLEAKKLELIQERLEEERVREEARKRQEEERERERELAHTRDRERGERRGRGGRYNDRRPPRRDSRSPPPRRRDGDDSYRAPPRTDSYVPASSRARRDDDRPRRRRSPSLSRSRSRSRSPPPRRRRRNSSSPSRSPPPRRRRNSSSDRSLSRDRGNDRRRDRRGEADRNPRISDYRRRSRSPRRHDNRRRRSPSDSRSPPPKRSRRPTPSRSRSPPRKKRTSLAANDLMARKDRDRREPRLSRNPSSNSTTPPLRQRRRNTSSVESNDRRPANGGAEESGFHRAASRTNNIPVHPSRLSLITGVHASQQASSPAPPLVSPFATTAPAQQQERPVLTPKPENVRRETELRAQLLRRNALKEKAPTRRDSVMDAKSSEGKS